MNALTFALSRIGEPHRHHRHCVHNLSYEDQYAMRKRRRGSTRPEWTDEEMEILGLARGIVVITPDDWEMDVPDLDWTEGGLSDGSAEDPH